MFDGTYKIADVLVRINSLYSEVHKICECYETSGEVELIVSISQSDIEFERNKSFEEDRLEGKTIVNYSDPYLETLSVYRKFADYLSCHNACVFHGALVELNGEGYLFTAKSGTGKTTHVRNWLKMYPDAIIVNGDKPVLRLDDEGVIYGYGTPWSGKEGYHSNRKVPLKAIVILERDVNNSIKPIPLNEALSVLLNQCYRPLDPMGVKRALDMCVNISKGVRLYRLKCNMDVESAKVAYEGINKDNT